jgi:hypothetical protein
MAFRSLTFNDVFWSKINPRMRPIVPSKNGLVHRSLLPLPSVEALPLAAGEPMPGSYQALDPE